MNGVTRRPTDQERSGIMERVTWNTMSLDEAQDAWDNVAAITILERFVSDGPGYCGPIAWVQFSGGPDLFMILTWNGHDQCWESIKQDPQCEKM